MLIPVRIASVLALCWFFTLAAQAAGPSFDCKKARSWAEKTVCANPPLAELDLRMGELYSQVKKGLPDDARDDLVSYQRGFLKGREQCRQSTVAGAVSPVDCLAGGYQRRITELETQLAPPPAAGRSALEECYGPAQSRVEVGPCLDRKLDEATVALENTVNQMSAQMRELDAITSADIGAQRSFEASQQAFYQFRDATCRWHSAVMGGGTGAGDAYGACLVDSTRARTAEVRAQLAQ